MLFLFSYIDNGNNFIGLRGVHQAGHGAPRVDRRPRNMANLFRAVRVDIRINHRDNRSVLIVFRRLPGNQTTIDDREYISIIPMGQL